jgi:hypothetical protein
LTSATIRTTYATSTSAINIPATYNEDDRFNAIATLTLRPPSPDIIDDAIITYIPSPPPSCLHPPSPDVIDGTNACVTR